jgi:hypothetical protein
MRHSDCFACRHLRVLPLALSLELRYPLLDLDREHVIVELWLQRSEAFAQRVEDVRRERDGLPVRALPKHAHPPADEVDICPPNAQYLCATETRALHQENGRQFVR